jgi:hypothetical protein
MVYCEDFGIHRQLTIPQQNGVAKHMNRSLLDKTRSMVMEEMLTRMKFM